MDSCPVPIATSGDSWSPRMKIGGPSLCRLTLLPNRAHRRARARQYLNLNPAFTALLWLDRMPSLLNRDFHFARRIRAFIHQHASPHARFLHRTLRRSLLKPRSTWNRLEPPLSGHSSDTAPCLCSFFARVQRSPAILRAPAAPRSSAACRRTAAGS